jgi:hypothetical protein
MAGEAEFDTDPMLRDLQLPDKGWWMFASRPKALLRKGFLNLG